MCPPSITRIFTRQGTKKKNSHHAHMLTANTLLQYGSGKLLAFNKQLDPYVPNTFNAGSHDWVRVWRENWAAETSRSEKVAASKGHEPFDWNPAVQAVSLQDGVWCLVEHLG